MKEIRLNVHDFGASSGDEHLEIWSQSFDDDVCMPILCYSAKPRWRLKLQLRCAYCISRGRHRYAS